MARAMNTPVERPHVVIIGAGFGGLSAARKLARAPVRVTLIDQRNHHLFQPLLYQVATAGLSPNQVATPIRTIVRRQSNTGVVLDTVTGIDAARGEVVLGARRIKYDHLIVATGARHAYFGHDDWEQFAPGLKTLEDAIEQRKRILLAFEHAELEVDPIERQRLLTFIIVGGGPTGVEIAGAIAELAKKALCMDFRHINSGDARILLVEAGPRLLPAFAEELSAQALRSLTHLGVEVRLNAAVGAMDVNGATVGTERIESRCMIWAAGVASSPAAAWLGAPADRAGRAIVNPDLTIPGHANIFVIGDCASATISGGAPLPGVAPVAKQQGEYVARLIADECAGGSARKPFRYQDFGMLATVGRKSALADFGRFQLRGFIGWLFWCVAHIYFLIGFRNRVAVALDWAWSYLTFERGARLITGPINDPDSPSARTPAVREVLK